MSKDQELLGLLGGGLAAAAVHHVRSSDNLDRRIDRVDNRSRDALAQIDRWLNSGTVGRLLVAAVQDVIAGVAMSSPSPQAPAVVPSTAVVSRPDISGLQNATGNQWPVAVGTYNEEQQILTVGELTKFALALTYEEVRTALMSLVQASPPSLGTKVQIFNAFNALIASVASRTATWEQYKAAWDTFFNGALPSNPHQDPTKIPQAGSLGANVASVVPLAQSTDEVARFRITAGPGNIIASANVVFSVTYATAYQQGGNPISPIVLADQQHPFLWTTGNVTANGYSVFLSSGSIAATTTYDIKLLTVPGLRF